MGGMFEMTRSLVSVLICAGVLASALSVTTMPVAAAPLGCIANSAEPCPFDIYGYVSNQDGAPVFSANVTDGAGHVATTDTSGYYRIFELSTGMFPMTASRVGCQTTRKTVVTTVQGGLLNGGNRVDLQIACA